MKNALSNLLASAVIAAFTVEVGGDKWVQLLPAGTFSARDGRGPYTTGGQAEMERIVENSRRYLGLTDLVIDYDHQSVFGAVPGVGARAPAAGWIRELQVRETGIYGRVEWTEAASAAIQAKEYRYLSPVYAHSKKTGDVILIRMAALTNTPGLDLDQVAASALFNAQTPDGANMKKILEVLGLAEGSGEDAAVTAIQSMSSALSSTAVLAGLPATAAAKDVETAVQTALAGTKAVAKAAGLADDAKADDIVTAVQTAMAGAKPDPAKFVPVEQVAALQTQINDLAGKVNGDKAETAVMKAIEDGKLAPALKDWGLDLAKKDIAQFEAFASKQPSIRGGQVVPAKGELSAAASESDTAVMAALGIDKATFDKAAKAIDA